MGWVTIGVGIIQGITSICFFKRSGKICYGIALGFTLFFIFSVACKLLLGRISLFAISKTVCYVAILIILLLPGSRSLFGIGKSKG